MSSYINNIIYLNLKKSNISSESSNRNDALLNMEIMEYISISL